MYFYHEHVVEVITISINVCLRWSKSFWKPMKPMPLMVLFKRQKDACKSVSVIRQLSMYDIVLNSC